MAGGGMTIRVLIADDHELVRRGLVAYLKTFPEIVLVGEATNGENAVRLCDAEKPDIVLMDIIMPGLDGIAATQQINIAHPEVRVIVLSSSHDEAVIAAALEAGAEGYILKNSPAEELIDAIKSVSAGKQFLTPEVTQALIKRASRPAEPQYHLSEREQEILTMLVKGMNNSQIAEQLSISRTTVKFHLRGLFTKLNVSNRTEAVALAYQKHLID
jgi:NarL family two-component system response regulator LiaR